eukprot:COSAG02_NODE_733_length_17960_cov_122.222440_9_plen_75_part_00
MGRTAAEFSHQQVTLCVLLDLWQTLGCWECNVMFGSCCYHSLLLLFVHYVDGSQGLRYLSTVWAGAEGSGGGGP